jgi:hypothetical protein
MEISIPKKKLKTLSNMPDERGIMVVPEIDIPVMLRLYFLFILK